jgi:hypothetical protein
MARSSPDDGAAPRAAPKTKGPRKSPTPRSTSSRTAPEPRAARSAPPPFDQGRPGSPSLIGGLGGLLRGSGSMLGQISGLDSPARSLERLATAVERGAMLLDRLEHEVGVDRVLATLERIDHAVMLMETIGASLEAARRDGAEMRASLVQIEERVVDLHARAAPPLDAIPLTRPRRQSSPRSPLPS